MGLAGERRARRATADETQITPRKLWANVVVTGPTVVATVRRGGVCGSDITSAWPELLCCVSTILLSQRQHRARSLKSVLFTKHKPGPNNAFSCVYLICLLLEAAPVPSRREPHVRTSLGNPRFPKERSDAISPRGSAQSGGQPTAPGAPGRRMTTMVRLLAWCLLCSHVHAVSFALDPTAPPTALRGASPTTPQPATPRPTPRPARPARRRRRARRGACSCHRAIR